MSFGRYILKGHEPIRCEDPIQWCNWFEEADRCVDVTVIKTKTMGFRKVSTVFLGIDHNFGRDGPPILFETMVFPCNEDGLTVHSGELDQDRCCTWEQAEEQHKQMIEKWKER